MNIAMLPIAFQTSSATLMLFIKLPNKALDEGDNATAELSGQLDKRERNNAPKNEIKNYVHPHAHDSVSDREA
jgi:hypothetical protein